MTIFHMKQSIAGCLRNNRVGTIDFLEDQDGNPLSDAEARIELKKLLAKGHTVMPVGDDCEGFDVFGGGCPGHEPLAGSDLTRAMLEKNNELTIVIVSDESDEAALEHDRQFWVAVGFNHDSGKFVVNHDFDMEWPFAIAINPKTGEPFTAREVGL